MHSQTAAGSRQPTAVPTLVPPQPGPVDGSSAEPDLAHLFAAHYGSLLGVAAQLIDDHGQREEVVQEAFLRVHDRLGEIRDRTRTLAYMRQTVLNLSRSRLRRRLVAAAVPVQHQPHARSAEEVTLDRLERSDLRAALRDLPPRQREAVVLRHCAGLSEAETAAAMGTGTGAVKSNASRGVAALRKAMAEQ